MGNWQVSQEAVKALRGMSARLREQTAKLAEATGALEEDARALEQGLGAHSADILQLTEELSQIRLEAERAAGKLCLRLERAAAVRQRHLEKNPYTGGAEKGGGTGYVKKTSPSASGSRVVYENQQIDPDLVIPAGTPFGNHRTLKESKTNLELMEEGKAPFVAVKNAAGQTVYVQVELHHLTGQEKRKGAGYFDLENPGGSLVEIPAHIHDGYDGILHIPKAPGESFRVDCDGEKSEDAENYEAFRREHWKERAREFRRKKPER